MTEPNENSMPHVSNIPHTACGNGGTADKAGWVCMGCAAGMMLFMILLIGGITLGLYGLSTVIADDNESGFATNAADDPENLEEEYVSGKRISGDQPKIAVVDVRGIIVSNDNSFNSSNIADPRLICTRIRRAASDSKVKALIVNLNTPGGEVVASDEIYAEIKRFRKTGKPAVAMLNTMAASGGYYVAAACHPIVAHKLTMTGSIGVIISTLNYRGLFDKIGLQSEVYTSGKMKDMLNGGRQRTPEEIRIVKDMVNRTYLEFSRIVAESRKIPVEKIRTTEIGDGRIFDGEQALKLGLVDSLGYFRDAEEAAVKAAKLKPESYTVIRYKESFNFARLVSLLSARNGAGPMKVSLSEAPEIPRTALRPGLLYFLPANY
ncbi:MAG: signal peptide peptidase SppA [Lentisphaeria bacterium]|nr:signal peptide peptidase SppA [Lentisphaeria bacterium]